MLRYMLNRIATSIVLSIFATLVVFLIASLVPGDPVLAMLGDLAASNPVIVAEYRAKWGLDLPLWEQYWIFLKRLAHGDLGTSISTNRSVLADIAQYAPATIELSTIAFILSVAIGVPLGIVAAVWRDSWIDHAARFISLIGVSSPVFWLAFIALTVFYGFLQIAPGPGRLGPIDFPPPTMTGIFLIDAALAGEWETWQTALAHLVLPSLVLCAATVGLITRTTRASMLDTLRPGLCARRARKGPEGARCHRPTRVAKCTDPGDHARRPRLRQPADRHCDDRDDLLLAGPRPLHVPQRPSLDLPAIMGMTLVFAIVYLIINLLVDLSYALVDPRVLKR